jgi:hypothetical protein
MDGCYIGIVGGVGRSESGGTNMQYAVVSKSVALVLPYATTRCVEMSFCRRAMSFCGGMRWSVLLTRIKDCSGSA